MFRWRTVAALVFVLLSSSTGAGQTPAAQASFLRGLALLHNFEYERAAADFQKAEAANPEFAMAYWGEAMTHNHAMWMEQDLAAARAALAKLGPTPQVRAGKAGTERERAYLATVETLYGEGTKADRGARYEAAMAEWKQADDVPLDRAPAWEQFANAYGSLLGANAPSTAPSTPPEWTAGV